MKIIEYTGLIIFSIGIVLFFIKQFNANYFPSSLNDMIDLIWPVGLIIYGIGSINKSKNKKLDHSN